MLPRVLLLLTLAGSVAFAEDEQSVPPPAPASHGSMLNRGVPATVEVRVFG